MRMLACLFPILLAGCVTVAGDPAPSALTADQQYRRGLVHFAGVDVPQDYAVAQRWFRLAAEGGSPDGAFMAGTLAYDGVGTAPDPVTGVTYLRQAAEAGHPRAAYRLGMALLDGLPAPAEPVYGLLWLQRAALADYAPAMQVVGAAWNAGLFGAVDIPLAAYWLERAAPFEPEAAAARETLAERHGAIAPPRTDPARTPGFAEIVFVQGALRALGYDPGPVDGQTGPRTRAALTAAGIAGAPTDTETVTTLRQRLRTNPAS